MNTSSFEWAFNIAFVDERLSISDRLLLLYLAHIPSIIGVGYYATEREIVKETHLSNGAVNSGIHRLLEYGIIQAEQVRNPHSNAGHSCWRITLTKPIECAKRKRPRPRRA